MRDQGVRQSMAWLHSWAGLVLGWLLFAIFVTGTTAYFRQEITAWMQPELAGSKPSANTIDVALQKLKEVGAGSPSWRIDLPSDRRNTVSIRWQPAAAAPGGSEDTSRPMGQGRSDSGSGARRGGGGESLQRSASERSVGARTTNAEGERTAGRGGREFSERAADDSAATGRGGLQEGLAAEQAPPRQAEARGGRGGGGHGRGRGESLTLDATAGEVLNPRETAGGNFLYRFHYELHALPRNWARLIVGIATLAMFIAIISGIITHKKIFKDFFTFRPGKGQRSWLDSHNVVSVIALPFHLMITFSGLLLFSTTLLPIVASTMFDGNLRGGRGGGDAAEERQLSDFEDQAGEQDLAPLGPMIAKAEANWGQPVGRIEIRTPGKPGSIVELMPAHNDSITQPSYGGGLGAVTMAFSASSGEMLSDNREEPSTFVRGLDLGLGSLHRAVFAGPFLRWLFFLAGVLGTVMAGSGLVLWSVKRNQKRKGATGHFGEKIVDHLNVGAVSGLFVALAGYFWANRLLPVGIAERAGWEVNAFFLVWLAGFVHPFFRSMKSAWTEQLAAAGTLFVLIPVLNLVTTKAHLGNTLVSGNWIYAGFDITCLIMGIVLLQAARKVHLHSPKSKPKRKLRPASDSSASLVSAE